MGWEVRPQIETLNPILSRKCVRLEEITFLSFNRSLMKTLTV